MTLEVACEAAIAADPCEGAFNDPALGQDDEAVKIGALDDLEFPGAGLGHGIGRPLALVAAVGEDPLDEGEQAARSAQQRDRTVAILDICGMDEDVQQKTKRVDEDVALAARRLLARVVARRVERGPPFKAPRAVWLSMIAAVGLASRPCRSRS